MRLPFRIDLNGTQLSFANHTYETNVRKYERVVLKTSTETHDKPFKEDDELSEEDYKFFKKAVMRQLEEMARKSLGDALGGKVARYFKRPTHTLTVAFAFNLRSAFGYGDWTGWCYLLGGTGFNEHLRIEIDLAKMKFIDELKASEASSIFHANYNGEPHLLKVILDMPAMVFVISIVLAVKSEHIAAHNDLTYATAVMCHNFMAS
ncbi:hypothetical protein AJ78_06232 [Emergomyces pasteurianus Ep9510]|uniref:Uncharacterized protein n=1 Tax=Emergomyces pasteurianus Ep9510 TaxID=1447872 RepID=A0A1J9QBN0_9EURO|nr:hypothetical protein AJ78_06232 [Emergomyces pasteurianus Ep9510]